MDQVTLLRSKVKDRPRATVTAGGSVPPPQPFSGFTSSPPLHLDLRLLRPSSQLIKALVLSEQRFIKRVFNIGGGGGALAITHMSGPIAAAAAGSLYHAAAPLSPIRRPADVVCISIKGSAFFGGGVTGRSSSAVARTKTHGRKPVEAGSTRWSHGDASGDQSAVAS